MRFDVIPYEPHTTYHISLRPFEFFFQLLIVFTAAKGYEKERNIKLHYGGYFEIF